MWAPPACKPWITSWPTSMKFHPRPSPIIASGCCDCRMVMSAMTRRIMHRLCLLLPALQNRYVTFGSFNNPAKIGPGRRRGLGAEFCAGVPEARLVLKYKGMGDPALAGRLAKMFAGHGIDPGRVAFLGKSPHADLLAHYNSIDIGLDPFPYNGGLTTCEALWMGVPVITCPGETFAGRHSLTHLSNVGLTQTIARDLDEYVNLAVSLANDLPGLAAMRSGLRERMAASPLCDGQRFAANLASLLRDVWELRTPGEL